MKRLFSQRNRALLRRASRLRWLMVAGMVWCAGTDVACAGEIIEVCERDLQQVIDGDGAADGDIVGGVVRDIVGRGVVRDVVSISGGGGIGHRIRNVLVENVRCYESRLRGAVEISDGADTITVRTVYAESAGKEPGTLTDYLIAGNLATVDDRIRGERAIVIENLK